jgi:hypothetical protein
MCDVGMDVGRGRTRRTPHPLSTALMSRERVYPTGARIRSIDEDAPASKQELA